MKIAFLLITLVCATARAKDPPTADIVKSFKRFWNKVMAAYKGLSLPVGKDVMEGIYIGKNLSITKVVGKAVSDRISSTLGPKEIKNISFGGISELKNYKELLEVQYSPFTGAIQGTYAAYFDLNLQTVFLWYIPEG